MKKILVILFLNLFFFNTGFSESYYFKQCKLTEALYGDYLIDFDKSAIYVKLEKNDGTIQEWKDKIELIEKDQIYSERILSRSDKDYYFVYYLDGNSKSVTKQRYKKDVNNIFWPTGPKQQSYCSNVKADWDKDKKETELRIIEEKKKQVMLKRKEELEKVRKKKKAEKENNQHKISIKAEKWTKLSKANMSSKESEVKKDCSEFRKFSHKYNMCKLKNIGLKKSNSDSNPESLKNIFNAKATELCSATESFLILDQKIRIVEIDTNPAFDEEAVVKFGIDGTIECK